MPVSNVLQSFRKGGYGSDPGSDKPESSSPRIIKLTDEEIKDLQQYQTAPGQDQTCEVTGRFGDNGEFSVISVRSSGGENAMGAEDMAKVAGMPKNG